MRIHWSELGEGMGIALGALKTNKLRTVLTTLGIFIGVIVVTVIISVIQGLNKYVSNQLSVLGTDTLYIMTMPWKNISWEERLKFLKHKRITSEQYHSLQKLVTLAEAVAPEINTQKTVKMKNESLDNVRIRGTTDAFMTTANAMPERGRFFTPAEIDNRRNVCVLCWEVADKLFKDNDPVGKTIKIGTHPFLVLGVIEKRGKILGDNQDDMVLIPYTVFEKLFGTKHSLVIQAKAIAPQYVAALNDELEGFMRRIRGLKASQENDFFINQQSQLMDMYNNLTRVLWIVLIGIGSISLLVGGIGIMNIMLVSVTERTREIGIRKAVGAKKRAILWQFLVESVFVSGIGVFLGLVLSVLIAILIRSASPIPVDISAWVMFLGIGFTVAIGLFFGLYPASKATKLDPIEALRHE